MKRRQYVPFLAALLLGACGSITGSFRNSGSNAFRGDVLSRYTHYSDEGNPWSASSDTLRGDGRGIQSVLIRNGIRIDNGYVEVDASNVGAGGAP